MVTVWWSAARLIHYSFLNPIRETITSEMEKPLHLRSMLSKSMRCIKNCHACNKYWSTKGQCFSTTMSDCMSHNQCFKSWTNWAPKLCLIHHIHLTSHQKLTTSLSISTTFFAGETLPQRVGGRKCFPRVHWILKHGFLCFRNKPVYLSLAKMCSLQ